MGWEGNDVLYVDGWVYDGDTGFHKEDPQRGWNETANRKPDDNDSGNDTFYGGRGTDTMYGGLGNDLFYGESNPSGNDLEADIYDGGGYSAHALIGTVSRLLEHIDGFDTVDYSFLSFAIEVDYTNYATTGYATAKRMGGSYTIQDKLYSIEGLKLTNYNDHLKLLAPEAGVERHFDGGGGENTIQYMSSVLIRDDAKGVVYNMDQTGKDIITNFQNVIGAPLVTVTSSDDEIILTMPALYIAPNVTKAYALNASSGSIVDYAASEYDLSFALGYGYGGDLRQELGAAPKMIYGSTAYGNTVYVGTAGAAFTGGMGDDDIITGLQGVGSTRKITLGYRGGDDTVGNNFFC